jgi:NAD(P)-dependent dehydrogenase (short-subunit alcohol dehydrogenase family)
MKTIIVSGGNRGIGLEICRQLDELGHLVILGSRDFIKGQEAARSFSKNLIVKQLDVTNEESIQHLFEFVKSTFGKLDILINNAGIGATRNNQGESGLRKVKNFMEKNSGIARKLIQKTIPIMKKAGIDVQKKEAKDISLLLVKQFMETNFYGPWRMIQVFIPLLKESENGRIINMSSGMGELQNLSGVSPGYSLSKTSLNALTIMFSNELKKEGIKVNAMCPGWVKTDMGGPNATREVNEGADTAVWLATEKNIPTGKFFRDRNEIGW